MLLVCLVLSILSMGIVVCLSAKNTKLSKETVEAKKDFLEARSKTLLVEEDYWVMKSTVKDMFNVVSELKKDVVNLSNQLDVHRLEIEHNRIVIEDLHGQVQDLHSDNIRLKRKLNIYDEVAPHCKLVAPVKTKI